jgi:uncharacterized protein (TIGR02246 family)
MVVAAAAVALLCAASSVWAGGAVDEVRSLESSRRHAMIAADGAALQLLLAPDCTYTHSTGVVQTRDDVVAMLASKKVRYVSFTTPSETYHEYGEGTVVITGTQTIALEVEEKPRTVTNRFTVVWVNMDGSWSCVAYQSTSVPETKQ